MSEYRYQTYGSTTDGLKSYMNKVFVNMALALGVTALVAFACFMSVINGGFVYKLLVNFSLFPIIILFANVGIAIAFNHGLTNYSTSTMKSLMFVYAAITGVTFSTLPMVYGIGTVFQAFVFAAVLFVSCAVIGYTTKVDMTRFSGLLMGGLLALVVMTILSFFIPFLANSLMIGYLGLAIFLALTAWDMQKLKNYYYQIGEGTFKENLAVFSAFQLYLDFINIFLYVLRILGSRSRD